MWKGTRDKAVKYLTHPHTLPYTLPYTLPALGIFERACGFIID